MAYRASGTLAGLPALDEIDTVQKHAWGKEIDGLDPVYGGGRFVYVKGVSGGFAGALVTYNSANGITILAPAAGTTNGGAPVAVLLAALDATTKYGWAQIAGDAIIKKTAVKVTPGSTSVFLSGTAGRIMQTSVASRRVLGAKFTSLTTVTSTTSTAVVNLNRPHIQSAP